jgi:hypothetical protein
VTAEIQVYEILSRDTLDSAACVEGLATKDDGDLLLQAVGVGEGEGDNYFAATLDLASLAHDIAVTDVTAQNDDRVARQMGFARPA